MDQGLSAQSGSQIYKSSLTALQFI